MGNGSCQLDMPHALSPHAREGDFHRALFADDALVLHALVLAAQAFIVLDRAEDARAEQAIALGLERAIVDGLRLFDLTVGPGKNLLWARNRDPDLVEDLSRHLRAEKIHELLVHRILRCERQTTRRLCDSVALSRRLFSDYSAASAASPPGPCRCCFELCKSTLRPSERISLTSTLNDSGIPASNVSSPRTMASYTLVRPATSSDFTVSISCNV